MEKQFLLDADIKAGIVSALKKNGAVGSEEELADMVLEELKDRFPNASLKPEKAKLLSLETPGVTVTVFTKKTEKEQNKTCPECGSVMKVLHAQNLLDQRVPVGLECVKCDYSGIMKKFSDFKFEFALKE